MRHEPAPDVAYQPGVDVHGRAVAPADLNGGSQIELPDVIYIGGTYVKSFATSARLALYQGPLPMRFRACVG